MGLYPRHKVRTTRRALVWTLILFLPVAECTLRVLGVSNPVFAQPDPKLGLWHIPGSEGWWGKEGGAFVKINAQGMRDVERTPAKPAGAFRIAVLGDSYAEALQVPQEKTFCSWIERDLAAYPEWAGNRVEVLNFGCSGYGTTQEYLLLRERVWDFEPDVIVLALTPATNIRNNSKALMMSSLAPYFLWEGGRPVLDTSFRESSDYRLRSSPWYRFVTAWVNRSRLLQVVYTLRSNLRSRWWEEQRRQAAGDGSGEAGLDSLVYKEPQDARWAEAWQVTEGVLRMIRDEAASHRARFYVVTLSSGFQVDPDPAERERAREQLGLDDCFYPDERLAAFLRREGVPTLPLAPAFQRFAEDRHVYLHGFRANGTLGRGHWNEDGHRLAGKLIAEWLRGQPGSPQGCPARQVTWQDRDPANAPGDREAVRAAPPAVTESSGR
jgi:hypothetical protein